MSMAVRVGSRKNFNKESGVGVVIFLIKGSESEFEKFRESESGLESWLKTS